MKKTMILFSLLGLTACQAPTQRFVYQGVGPRQCIEYSNSFRCSMPTQTWHETVYPKNEIHMNRGLDTIIPYKTLSRSVYGTY